MSERNAVTAVICAAGKGTRAGFTRNKLLIKTHGYPTLLKTVEAFDIPEIKEILVAVNECDLQEMQELCANFSKVRFVLGGETRPQTVFNALIETKTDVVLVHDGARPNVSKNVILACIESVKEHGSGIACIQTVDTVAVTDGERIISVPDRSALRAVQTPQGFFTRDILEAYKKAMESGKTYTDESSVYLDYIGAPRISEGARENVKFTYAEDFQAAGAIRVGFGVDTHAFGKEQNYVTLCGVKIPSDSGFIAHSDGDVALHAAMDALLSAAGLNDIGHYFPDTDAAFKDANSMDLLRQVIDLIQSHGYAVLNISIAIQAEKPRLKNYIETMKNTLANALDVPPSAVGITAGTNEKLGYVGEGKGVTVYAYVSLTTLSAKLNKKR
ncbi:MAG: 2-C-methyl-D-erythritol 2,4-cyclodiphosphate synthase [Clostridia bacterium]|nr:2-C-methyl-D-erythritol 2,4-cyclodiphosphate synthase [Clostridia bacterium]